MSSALIHEKTATDATPEIAFRHIAACVHGAAGSDLVLRHALAIARAFSGRVTLFRLVEAATAGEPPTDPLEWEFRWREAHEHLDELARQSDGEVTVATEVIEGRAADQIRLWAERHHVDLTVVCRCDEAESADWALVQALLDQMPGSVLMVQEPVTTETSIGQYRRLLVPVDGSPRAESVLPLALRVAASAAAELIVAHVVPSPGLTEVGPPDAEDIELRERITRRNVRVATAYLDRLRAQFGTSGSPPRMIVLHDGDVRTRLERLVEDEGVDLVMLSSHGHGGRATVPYGSVTADLVQHSPVPLLIVRPRARRAHVTMAPVAASGRLPRQAAS